MALTPFRWIAMAAIGCMLAVVMLVNAAEKNGRPIYQRKRPIDTAEARLREVAGNLNIQAQNLASRYRLLFLLDSARKVASRSADSGALRVFVADGFDPATRALIERAITRARAERPGSAARVDVIVIMDTLRTVRGVTRYTFSPDIRYEIPSEPGKRCRAIVRTGHPSNVRNAFTSGTAAQQLLGPCGFFAAFGEPGPRVREWLIGGGWQYTVDGSWTVAPVIELPRQDGSIFKGPSPALGFLALGSGTDCIKGALDACERSVVGMGTRRGPFSIGGATPSYQLGTRRFYAGGIGYRASELLSDAVRDLGKDRFKAFWTSADSVPVAFEKASGRRWGAFIQGWMSTHYGAIEPGPRLSGFGLLTGTLLIAAALGATMLMSAKRQYA
jgi:hypothetical protein